ncbi:hypothetical protein J6590_059269 [Homalodisca vitripennis]|nr:hypothetical protein J6590_059269 [Homalodisca vitripennis]
MVICGRKSIGMLSEDFTPLQWFDSNRLTVNICKTKHMAVSMRATSDPVGLELKMHNGRCGGRQIPCQCHSIEREPPYLVERLLCLGEVADRRIGKDDQLHFPRVRLKTE